MTTLEKIRAEFISRYPKNYANEPELCGRSCVFSLNEVLQIIDKYAEQEPKTGHWIEHPEIETSKPEYLMFYECSECGDEQCFCKSDVHKKRFCSNCGAKMGEPQESEDKG